MDFAAVVCAHVDDAADTVKQKLSVEACGNLTLPMQKLQSQSG